jgi:mono/diheme cytochrome c family protein
MKCGAWIGSLLTIGLLGIGCKTKSHTILEYMPDMYRQLSVHAQQFDPTAPNGIGMRVPPEGTVPRDYQFYPYHLADTTQANQLPNPLPPTSDVLAAGRKVFETWCIVCHGAWGDGHGFIVPKFTQPPVLYSDKVIHWPDGRIFHTITLGQGLMPSYALQILPEQRWAAVSYVRVLQRAANPSSADLEAAKHSLITFESDLPDTARPRIWPKQ